MKGPTQAPDRLRLLHVCILAASLMLALTAQSAATDPLERFFNGLKSIRAELSQTLTDADGNILQESKGRLEILRPGRFLWRYTSPYRQDITSDGTTLWVYDEDLAQVTVSPADRGLSGTPAMLLSSDTPLSQAFEIRRQKTVAGLAWYELVPRNPDTGFAAIRLAFRDQVLARMQLTDHFEQTTEIVFFKLQRNPAVDPDDFVFVPPPDVDVVQADGSEDIDLLPDNEPPW